MAKTSKEILSDLSIKSDVGELGTPIPISSTFDTIVDTRAENSGITLAQFFDNYKKFLENADFIYYGDIAPKNTHSRIWIDTSKSNQE